MYNKLANFLSRVYYAVAFVAVLTAAVMYMLIMKGMIIVLDPQSEAGVAIQYAVIIYALLTIPTGLYMFNRKCKVIRKTEDNDERCSLYKKYDTIRIIVIGSGMTFGIVAYYLLSGYQSMIWVAAIAAVGWYFCKPTERKIELEMQPYDDSY